MSDRRRGDPTGGSGEKAGHDAVQALWIGSELPFPARVALASFLREGHRVHLFCYEEVRGVPQGVMLEDAGAIVPSTRLRENCQGAGRGSYAAFSDLFRYALLHERGGWWVDVDVVCVRPFDFERPIVLASQDTRDGAGLASGVIRLPAGSDLAWACLRAAAAVPLDEVVWGEIGPALFEREALARGFGRHAEPPEVFCPVPWWHWRLLIDPDPAPAALWIRPETRGVHLAHEMWRRHPEAWRSGIPASSWLGRLALSLGIDVAP